VKHGVRFSDAESVLFDPLSLSMEDSSAEGEQRFISVGLDSGNRVVVVVCTYRERADEAGSGYQTMINEALREYLSKVSRLIDEELLRKVLREELQSAS